MTTVKRSVLIHASPDAVEEISTDPNRLPEWYSGIERVEPDGVFPDMGGEVAVTYKAAGIHFDLTMRSVEHVEGERQVNCMEGMIAGTNSWEYTPEGDGIRVTAIFDYEIPGGALGQMADKMLIERMNTENLEKSLEALKTLAEG